MRLYTPAKSSSSGGEDSEREREISVTRRDKTFPYETRPGQRTSENDQAHDDRLPRDDTTTTTTNTTTSTPIHLSRLQDSLPFKSPLREDNGGMRTEVNGDGHEKQNGANEDEISSELLQNGSDTFDSLDSVPWNLEGIETIKENGCKTLLGKWALEENGEHGLHEEDELQTLREDNKKLKAALKEAAEVNGQWRQYHEQRQRYVERLLATLHELQHPRTAAHSPRQQLEVDQGSPEGEARRLQEALTRLQADHDEHVTLLEMQVRAHRDDWEAERSEKQATQTALAEAQARTALLLQELQLLQAKLADTESKRGLCWRCAGPRSSEPHSASPSTQASPVPAPSAPSPSPGPAASPTPLQEAPQAPLKGWIPVSMLHQIAFSGATPEHQTPVVQRPLTPSRGGQQHHHHHHHHHHHQQRPTSLNTSAARQGEGCQLDPRPRSGDSKAPSPRRTPSRDKTPVSGEVDERKKYEAMGARPKVLGNLQSVIGKEEESIEDEKSAKHRARSILASALPVSPVSAGPATPFGVTKSPSTPNMPKGYVPITSTILTPVNFRPPFVANKRPPSVKQNIPPSTTSSSSSSCTTPTHPRSGSSASPAATTTTTTTTTTSAGPVRQTTTSSTPAEPQTSIQQNINHLGHTTEASKSTAQETKATKSHSRGSKAQVKAGTQDRKKTTTTSTTTPTNTHPSAANTTTLATTTATLSTHSTTSTSNTNTTQSRTNHNEITSLRQSSLHAATTTTTTTTLSSSSPTPSTSYHVSSSHSRSSSVSSKGSSQHAGDASTHQPVHNPGFLPITVVRASSFAASPVNASSQPGAVTKGQDGNNNGKGRIGGHRVSHKATKSPSPLLPEVSATTTTTTTTTAEEGHPQTGPVTSTTTVTTATTTHSSSSSSSNNTAFAAITVTSTASSVHVPHSPSTYSSTPSSRSSSPGISLTTFGLNSEGRGIPGAIFFALGPEQRGTRSPQPGVSSRRASSSSSGTHSHTPDPVTASHPHEGRPPAGVRSPPVAPNGPATPSTVKDDQWWSVEGGGRGSAGSRQQHGAPGKLVNSTWVKLMGSRVDGRQSSGLPWRTARAVSGQTLKQVRRTPTEDSTGEPSDLTCPGSVSSTATFSYTPAINSPPSSANSSAASSPLPCVNQRDDLKSLASKNITSAIMSYEMSNKNEGVGGNTPTPTNGPEGIETLSRQDLVCPSCQMLFPPHKHMLFLDHFEVCHGPAYADL